MSTRDFLRFSVPIASFSKTSQYFGLIKNQKERKRSVLIDSW